MHQRIHILEIVFSLDVEGGGGGITRFAMGLVKNLDPLKFEVTLCSLSGYQSKWSQDRISQLAELGIHFLDCGPWMADKPLTSFLNAVKIMREYARRHPIDIIHSHSEFSDIAALLLKLSRSAPTLIRTVHNGYRLEWRKKAWRRFIFTNTLFPVAYQVEIGVNPTISERLSSRHMARILKRRALTIPNALEMERFSETRGTSDTIKQSLAVPPNTAVIGTIGRLTEEKGFPIFIDAAKLVLETRPDVYFIIIGGGPLEYELHAQANRIGIAKQVLFLGPRSDIEDLLASMDLFVCSSLWEGSPTAILESMAAGIPVIASDIPGIRTMVKHGENGWLITPGNAQDFSTAVIHLLDTPSIRQNISQNAVQSVQDYSIEKISRQHADLYMQLVNHEKIPE